MRLAAMRAKPCVERHGAIDVARCARVVAQQSVIATRLAVAGAQRGDDSLDGRQAGIEVEPDPLAHVIFWRVDVQAHLPDGRQPRAMPQARLDVGGHDAGDRRVRRQRG